MIYYSNLIYIELSNLIDTIGMFKYSSNKKPDTKSVWTENKCLYINKREIDEVCSGYDSACLGYGA